ncbi:DedA family protein [Kytococcus sp. Marseille-QA3725]
MPDLNEWITRVIDALGGPGLALMMLLETVFPPIPSELVLPLAGFTIGQGQMGWVEVMLWTTGGAVLGAVILYGVARAFGRQRTIRWMAKLPLVDEDDADAAHRWFDRYGKVAVLTGRCVPGVRSLISIPAGTSQMPFGTFFVYTLLGTIVWNAMLVGLGYALGANWHAVEGVVSIISKVVLVLLVLGVMWFLWKKAQKRRAVRS